MEKPLEGKQLPINNATKKQLRDFATHLGCVTSNFDNEDALRTKMAAAGWEEGYIVVSDPATKAPKAAAARTPVRQAVHAGAGAKAPAEMTEPMVSLMIHEQPGPGGKRPVFVAVNGRGILIPRNKRSEVKLRFYNALNDAVETKYEYDEDTKTNSPRDMHSYPFLPYRIPTEEEQQAWHAWEAKEEAKLARAAAASKRHIPVNDDEEDEAA